MAEYRERSGLFKFFYIILRVITFPLFLVIYVLKHPLWVLTLLFVVFCLAIYYPLAEGKKLADVPEWYKNKYYQVRVNIVQRAAEGDDLGLISQSLQDELQREAEEARRPKSENYNAKVMREDKIEAKTSDLKKRSGFKKKNVPQPDTNTAEEKQEDVLNQSAGAVGGLADVLKAYQPENSDVLSDVEEEAISPSQTNVEKGKEVLALPENVSGLLPYEEESDKAKNTVADDKVDADEFDLF